MNNFEQIFESIRNSNKHSRTKNGISKIKHSMNCFSNYI